jgi:hypothetical protein
MFVKGFEGGLGESTAGSMRYNDVHLSREGLEYGNVFR